MGFSADLLDEKNPLKQLLTPLPGDSNLVSLCRAWPSRIFASGTSGKYGVEWKRSGRCVQAAPGLALPCV